MPKGVKAMFFGHLHLMQAILPSAGAPLFIVGNSGTELDCDAYEDGKCPNPDGPYPQPDHSNGCSTLDATVKGFNKIYGYGLLDQDQNQWQVRYFNKDCKDPSSCPALLTHKIQ